MCYSNLAVFVVETIEVFSAVMQDFGKRIKSNSPFLPVTEKRKRVEDFYFIGRPNVVEVQQLDVVRTKGSCNDSGNRLVSQKEKPIMLQSKPKRSCVNVVNYVTTTLRIVAN